MRDQVVHGRDAQTRRAGFGASGLGIFGAFTIVDFNRLRRENDDSAVVIASSIFLDIANIYLLLLDLFGGERS